MEASCYIQYLQICRRQSRMNCNNDGVLVGVLLRAYQPDFCSTI